MNSEDVRKKMTRMQSFLALIILVSVTHHQPVMGTPARKGNSNEEVLKELGVEIKMKGT